MNTQIDLAPLALFVYQRLNHTKATVEALAQNNSAKSTNLWIFSDGPKCRKSEKKINEVRDYIDTISKNGWFKSVTIMKSPKNKGLANSIIGGVSMLTAKYGSIIVVEDDLVTAPDFLDFMNRSLDFYRTNPSIGSITGYSPISSCPRDYKHDIYLASRNCSYGWGTWSDRWERVDWGAKEYQQLRRSLKLRKQFNQCGLDRFNRLRRQMNGKIDSWSIRFGLFQFMNDLYTVYPVVSRLKNIGWDGSGTHGHTLSAHFSLPFNNRIEHEKTPFRLEHVEINPMIIKSICNVYSGNLRTKTARKLENYLLLMYP